MPKKLTALVSLLLFLFSCNKEVDSTEIEFVVRTWNELHNSRQVEKFKTIYAPNVIYYGRGYTGQTCYERKKKFLTPDFYHIIISPISFTTYKSGKIKAEFRKQVKSKKGVNEHDCYLLIEKINGEFLISGESDYQTDKNLGVRVDLGEVESDSNTSWIIGLIILTIGIGIWWFKKKNDRNMESDLLGNYSVPSVTGMLKNQKDETLIDAEALANVVGEKVIQRLSQITTIQRPVIDKGKQFENYIVEKFPKSNFTLIEWRSDKFHNGIYPKSSHLPDLVYHYKDSRNDFHIAVECKWRRGYNYNKVEWARQDQLETYKRFGIDQNMEVFLALGIGGEPNFPSELYMIPLREVYSCVLTKFEIKDYAIYPASNFFLSTNRMDFSQNSF